MKSRADLQKMLVDLMGIIGASATLVGAILFYLGYIYPSRFQKELKKEA